MHHNFAITVPKTCYAAVSGGVDSISMAHILIKKKDITLLHFVHDDTVSEQECEVVDAFAVKFNLKLLRQEQKEKVTGNREHSWRTARYEWFHSFDGVVCTGHTLDDALEWYLMTCLMGRGEYMTRMNKNVYRPMLYTEKKDILEYAKNNSLEWFEDPTNQDADFSMRNKVRSVLAENVLEIQPMMKRMVMKRIMERGL